MTRRERRRVDWEEERRRTEQSHIRGLRHSALSFFMAFFFMLMAQVFHRDYPLRVPILVLGALLVGNVILLVLAFRRKRSESNDKKR